MNLLRFFRRAPAPQTAPAARERLQILLTHERSSGNQPDLVAILREEILAVVGKHVKIEPDAVDVRVERGKDISTLEIEVEVPFVGATTKPAEPAKVKPVQHKKASHKKRKKAA
ncbi:MAG: cell division topological specificity factor MinE [Hyphomicrobiales bacterium]